MAIPTATFARPAPEDNVRSRKITPDRRRHKRINLTLLGRFLRANKEEFPCKLIDISVGGAAILSPTPVKNNERIIAYFDQIGGLEGNVVRSNDRGFAIQFIATRYKREKLAAQLTYLLNRQELGPHDERRHDRIAPSNGSSTMKLAEGVIVRVQVLDVSVSGASVGTEARPPLGHAVLLGKLRAKVVRHHDQGIGVEFLDTQDIKTVRKNFE